MIAVQEITLKCRKCGKPLADLIISETNEMRRLKDLKPQKCKYKILNCFYCNNGESYETPVYEGTISILPRGKSIENVDTDQGEDNITTCKIKVNK